VKLKKYDKNKKDILTCYLLKKIKNKKIHRGWNFRKMKPKQVTHNHNNWEPQ